MFYLIFLTQTSSFIGSIPMLHLINIKDYTMPSSFIILAYFHNFAFLGYKDN